MRTLGPCQSLPRWHSIGRRREGFTKRAVRPCAPVRGFLVPDPSGELGTAGCAPRTGSESALAGLPFVARVFRPVRKSPRIYTHPLT